MRSIILLSVILGLLSFRAYSQPDELEEKFITLAAKGDFAKVTSCVKKGVNVNAKNRARWTALAYACKYGHGEIVQYLVENGANIDLTVNVGSTPLQVALNSNNFKIADYLIKKGADVNIPDITGMTALAWAAKSGDLKTVKYLIEHGADVNSKNVNARTILDNTTDPEVIAYLKSAGAKTGKELMQSS
ncbi:MAG: ankyrin repeat domain-containing protein [Bacteroidota bacterium]